MEIGVLEILITLAINAVIVGIGYGMLKSKLDNVSKMVDSYSKRQDLLQAQLMDMNNTLNRVLGQLEMYFKLAIHEPVE